MFPAQSDEHVNHPSQNLQRWPSPPAPVEIHSIKQVAAEVFGSGAHLFLFGSRVDDQRRGGDIDLYISSTALPLEAQLESKLKFLVKVTAVRSKVEQNQLVRRG